MPGKIVLQPGDSLPAALKRLRRAAKARGVLLGHINQLDHNRRKDYYLKPGIKRRQRKKLADFQRRRALLRRKWRDVVQPDFIACG